MGLALGHDAAADRQQQQQQEEISALPDAAAPETIPYGLSGFNWTYNNRTIPIFTYKPPTYVSNPLLIGIPGRNRDGYEYMVVNTALAEWSNSVIATPDFGALGLKRVQTSFGNVFPLSAFGGAGDRTLLPGSQPLPQEEWLLPLIPALYQEVKRRLRKTDIEYYLYGDDGGGLFCQTFALIMYNAIEPSLRPTRIIAGISSYFIYPSYPRLKLSYLDPVDNGTCFAGEVEKLVSYKQQKATYHRAARKITKLMRRTLSNRHDEVVHTIADVMGIVAEAYATPLNTRLYDYRDRSVFHPPWPLTQPPLPFPFGLGRLPYDQLPARTYQSLVEGFLEAPLTVYLTSRDTNVYGGVTETCKHIPNLVVDVSTVPQGPYRLARGLNFYSTARAYAQELGFSVPPPPSCRSSSKRGAKPRAHRKRFGWRIAICPGVGHNSFSDAHCLQLYHGIFGGGDWRKKGSVVNVFLDPSFSKEHFHLEVYPPEAPDSLTDYTDD